MDGLKKSLYRHLYVLHKICVDMDETALMLTKIFPRTDKQPWEVSFVRVEMVAAHAYMESVAGFGDSTGRLYKYLETEVQRKRSFEKSLQERMPECPYEKRKQKAKHFAYITT